MSLVGSLRGVQAIPEPCNSNSNSIMRQVLKGHSLHSAEYSTCTGGYFSEASCMLPSSFLLLLAI
jgi:hypothetical protein